MLILLATSYLPIANITNLQISSLGFVITHSLLLVILLGWGLFFNFVANIEMQIERSVLDFINIVIGSLCIFIVYSLVRGLPDKVCYASTMIKAIYIHNYLFFV